MSARGKIPEALRPLLRSELEKAIYEAALHRDDDLIARRYMIDKWAQADIAAQACDTRNTIQNTTRDIIDNANANSRAILDALNANYIRSLESENQGLKLAASQANQNAVLMAAMDANKAEILRRTGAECPTPAYWVNPPTPVQAPCGGCGC